MDQISTIIRVVEQYRFEVAEVEGGQRRPQPGVHRGPVRVQGAQSQRYQAQAAFRYVHTTLMGSIKIRHVLNFKIKLG